MFFKSKLYFRVRFLCVSSFHCKRLLAGFNYSDLDFFKMQIIQRVRHSLKHSHLYFLVRALWQQISNCWEEKCKIWKWFCKLLFRSFFQLLCVIGYCLLPSVFASLACHLLHFNNAKRLSVLLRLVCSAVGFVWSTYGWFNFEKIILSFLASTAFLASSQPEKRKILIIYPIMLFYFVVSWMVFSNS